MNTFLCSGFIIRERYITWIKMNDSTEEIGETNAIAEYFILVTESPCMGIIEEPTTGPFFHG